MSYPTVGDIVRSNGDTGTVRELVTVASGLVRARVHWRSDGCEQFVDLDKLTVVRHGRTDKEMTL